MPEMVQINFNRWFPVFPLAGACLLPHTSIPLRIFEPRYVQMLEQLIDGADDELNPTDMWSGLDEPEDDEASSLAGRDREPPWRGTRQFALALFDGDQWKKEYHGNPPIRPAVCIAQIERHERLLGGRFDIIVQGICRSRIVEERMPDEGRMFRLVRMLPLESNPDLHEPALVGWRSRVRELLDHDSLAKLRYQPNVVQLFDRDEIPSYVLVEFAGHLLMTSAEDAETRYELLSKSDPVERATFVERQLLKLERHINAVQPQRDEWPKGLSWN